jgi:hypothetical protein
VVNHVDSVHDGDGICCDNHLILPVYFLLDHFDIMDSRKEHLCINWNENYEDIPSFTWFKERYEITTAFLFK